MGIIKFRQRVNNRWHYWGMNLMADGVFTGPLNPTDPCYQFTGLKDNSGVEIYEGDIVLVKMEGRLYTGVVNFEEFEFVVETNDHFWPVASWKCVESVKVVGNTQDDPDFMEQYND